MSNIKDIVHVEISIGSPAVKGEDFGGLLIITKKPSKAGTSSAVGVIKVDSEKKLLAYGYKETDEVYIAVAMAFEQKPHPDNIYIAFREVSGSSEETLDKTLDRALAYGGWYGVCLAGIENASDILAVAKWVESNSKLFGFSYASGDIPVQIGDFYRTFALCAGEDASSTPLKNKLSATAMMATCLGYEAGSETWALKELSGITPVPMSASKIDALKSSNINYYQAYAGKNVTQGGKVGAGEWIDVIRFRDWLLNEVQIRIFRYMTDNAKISFDDNDITGIQNAILSALKDGQDMGGIARSYVDAEGNIKDAYLVRVPRTYEIPDNEKADRLLRGVSFEAVLAGAIHATRVTGNLNY